MSGGCTDCGKKGGCDHRKSDMFAAIDAALLRLYPTRRWDERDESAAFRGGIAPGVGARLADRLAVALESLAVFCEGGPDESCDFVYLLCFGRQPSLIELREGTVDLPSVLAAAPANEGRLDELYLRVALSNIGPFVAVQQVALSLEHEGGAFVLREAPRTGVFDPILLKRFQKLVAVLAELDLRHLDFGDISHPPPNFEGGNYAELYGGVPSIANYLFFAQPASAITTTVLVSNDLDRPARLTEFTVGSR